MIKRECVYEEKRGLGGCNPTGNGRRLIHFIFVPETKLTPLILSKNEETALSWRAENMWVWGCTKEGERNPSSLREYLLADANKVYSCGSNSEGQLGIKYEGVSETGSLYVWFHPCIYLYIHLHIYALHISMHVLSNSSHIFSWSIFVQVIWI